MEKGVPKNEVFYYLAELMKDGFIEIATAKEKATDTKTRIIVSGIKVNYTKMPREIPQEVLETRVSLLYDALENYFGAKIKPGVFEFCECYYTDICESELSDIYNYIFKQACNSEGSWDEVIGDAIEDSKIDLCWRIVDIMERLFIIRFLCHDEWFFSDYTDRFVVYLPKEEALFRIKYLYKKHGPVVD